MLSEGSMSLVSKAGIVCDGYTHKIMGSSRHKDYQVATAERIFSTFFMPLLYETCLVRTSVGSRPIPPVAGVCSRQYASTRSGRCVFVLFCSRENEAPT